jgi:uncharacterized SAM-binding protein YcdF (DUF218 family)
MLFALKKIIGYWLMPLPFCLALSLIGLLLTASQRRRRLGLWLLFTSFVWLLVCSNQAFSRFMLKPLEGRYSPVPEISLGSSLPDSLASCRFILVLGGGHGESPWMPSSSQLSESSLGRLTEAVRLSRLLPQAKIILSGPSDDAGGRIHAQVLRDAAHSLGLAPERIQLIDTARDTAEEAVTAAGLIGSARTALITSAWHMPRAAAIFRHQGVDVLPCPADFKGKPNPRFNWRDYEWDSESLNRSTLAIREYIGLAWATLRRQT